MIPTLIYLDRYRNEGTRSYSRHAGYSEAERRFQPCSTVPTFEIPTFEVPLSEVNLYSAQPHPDLHDLYVSENRALFCIHPQILNSHQNDPYLKKALSVARNGPPIQVSPSSSTRTLYVHGSGPPHALKVHFPFRVSRYGRRMRDEVVEQAVTVSGELQASAESLGPDFAFLREVMGITYKKLEEGKPRGENWGFLIRDMTPFPEAHEEASLVPGFSLYGRDFFNPREPPLILKLMEGKDPLAFVLEEIFLPIIRHWGTCLLNLGLALEPHGQNVLLEVTANGGISRIVYRDLNLGIDNRRRREIRLPVDEGNTYNQMESGSFNSITYDKFMGGHFFDQLVGSLQIHFPKLRMEDFRAPCRQEFARVLPAHEEYLPRTVHYFSEERDEFGKPLFLDTGLAPAWRP